MWKYLLYFLPFLIYLFLYSNPPLLHWLYIVCVIALVALGIFELRKGILVKDNRKIINGITKVLFGILGLLFSYNLLNGNWLFFLTLVIFGIGALVEQFIKK